MNTDKKPCILNDKCPNIINCNYFHPKKVVLEKMNLLIKNDEEIAASLAFYSAKSIAQPLGEEMYCNTDFSLETSLATNFDNYIKKMYPTTLTLSNKPTLVKKHDIVLPVKSLLDNYPVDDRPVKNSVYRPVKNSVYRPVKNSVYRPVKNSVYCPVKSRIIRPTKTLLDDYPIDDYHRTETRHVN